MQHEYPGYEIGEFDEDGALDELDSFIASLVKRAEEILYHPQFCSVDVSGARAIVAMLATIIAKHGGGNLIKRKQVRKWAEKIDETFTNEKLWAFTSWPEEIKSMWRDGCKQTTERLLDVLED